jgi:hypothetical protein
MKADKQLTQTDQSPSAMTFVDQWFVSGYFAFLL